MLNPIKYCLLVALLFSSSVLAKGSVAEVTAPVLQALHVGQVVSLSDKGGMYKVDVLDDGKIGTHEVTDLTASYLGLVDIVGMTTIRIPVTSISAISITNTKKFVKR